MQQPAVRDLQLAYHLNTFGRYEILLPNIHFLHNEMDMFGFRKGSSFSDEIEIKLTKSDFLADFKKTTYIQIEEVRDHPYISPMQKLKHDALRDGLHPCNYFYFLMPEVLAGQCDIPHYAGLYTFKNWNGARGYVTEAKKAPRLHSRRLSDNNKYEIAKKATYKCWDMMKA